VAVLGFAQDDEFVVVWRFYAGPSALGFVGGVTQPYGLGWDMAAPLALSKDDLGWHSVIVGAKQGRRQKQIRSTPPGLREWKERKATATADPYGMTNKNCRDDKREL